MELKQEQPFVNAYHYDARNLEWEKEHGAPKSNAEVKFQLMEKNEDTQTTTFMSVLHFIVVQDQFVVSGVLSQINYLHNRLVDSPNEFTQAEVETISAPLLQLLKRLTYEVTEIALDQPGVSLEF